MFWKRLEVLLPENPATEDFKVMHGDAVVAYTHTRQIAEAIVNALNASREELVITGTSEENQPCLR